MTHPSRAPRAGVAPWRALLLVVVLAVGFMLARRVTARRADAAAGADSTATTPRTDSASAAVRPIAFRVPFRVPEDSEITDTAMLTSVRRGRALMLATRDSLPGYVGNRLRCVSCHLGDGLRANAMPFVGVYARFPQYRSRSGSVQIIEDRIDDCFERSMNGKALPRDSRDLHDIVSYMAFLSLGVPVGAAVEGQGFPRLQALAGDTARGRALFATKCVACHGASGEGTVTAPPLWGAQSYNIGAGMARVRTAAAFIRWFMPNDNPGTLTDQEAFDLAAFVNAQPRPDFASKAEDWPNGDPPPDVAYRVRSVKK